MEHDDRRIHWIPDTDWGTFPDSDAPNYRAINATPHDASRNEATMRLFGKKNSEEDRLRAFEAMVLRDWDRFWRYAYRLCANAEDAEDLLSDSLLEAFQSFDRYRGEGFDKWLFRILTTNRIDMARRSKIRRAESLDSGWNYGEEGEGAFATRCVADYAADPARIVLDPLLGEEVQGALFSLPEEFRAVVLLCDVEQMEYQEIARVLRLPIGTIRSRIHRARGHMRRYLEKSAASDKDKQGQQAAWGGSGNSGQGR